MASKVEDQDVFQRKVQQKLLEQFDENAPGAEKPASVEDSKKKSPFCVQNILLLIAAVAVFYFADFLKVMMYDQRVYITWYWIGTTSFTLHIGVCLFLAIYCNFFRKIGPDEWETRYPKAIPIAAASFIIGILCLSVGLWPVYGILSPVILGILFLGVVVIVAMFG
ncbi:transmembrane protein 128 [Aplysia californica]|uniref:Transmembrane protein 128 n=1 Tax=Aplysia californica TaxID=6500 RepID=A0ABM0JBF8_APLCA|nr:transmembrane protein 128 [Aplysia californica]